MKLTLTAVLTILLLTNYSIATGQAGSKIPQNRTQAPAEKVNYKNFNGVYMMGSVGQGYWQKLTIENTTANEFNVAVSFGQARKGCRFNGKGLHTNKRIEIDLKKVNPDLKGIMIIEFKGNTATVSTASFDDRFSLMWFCGGGGSLAGDYIKTKTNR